MFQTRNYLASLFLLSKPNAYQYNQDRSKDFWTLANDAEKILRALRNVEIDTTHFYNYDLDAFKHDNPNEINLYNSFFKNDQRLNQEQLERVLQVNTRILRFESRKKAVLSYILPVFNLLVSPLMLPICIAKDLFVHLPLAIVFDAALKVSDYYDGSNIPNAPAEQSSNNNDTASNVTWSAYCCSKPITTCFNIARQCFGYGINATKEPDVNLPTQEKRRMEVA